MAMPDGYNPGVSLLGDGGGPIIKMNGGFQDSPYTTPGGASASLIPVVPGSGPVPMSGGNPTNALHVVRSVTPDVNPGATSALNAALSVTSGPTPTPTIASTPAPTPNGESDNTLFALKAVKALKQDNVTQENIDVLHAITEVSKKPSIVNTVLSNKAITPVTPDNTVTPVTPVTLTDVTPVIPVTPVTPA